MPSFEADPTNIAICGNVCRGNPSVVAPYLFAVDARAVVVKS